MADSRLAIALLAAAALSGEEISVGVFSLFRPDVLLLRRAGQQVSRITSPASFPRDAEFTLEIPGRISREFQGRLSVTETDGLLTPVVTMDLETAVGAAVAAEMPHNAPVEALKALAIVVRSFYTSATGRHERYDFCDTTHCQFHREPPPSAHPAAQAAIETAGVVIAYRGERFAPMYSASCGGRTFRAENVGLSAEPYPYHAVSCDRCARSEPTWTRNIARDLAAPLLKSPSEAARLDIVRKLGWSALPGNNYLARGSGEHVVFTGRGQGHGVGVCQRGAIAMAAEGATFRDILRHYLPQTELARH